MPHWAVLRRLRAAAPIGHSSMCSLADFPSQIEPSEKAHGAPEQPSTWIPPYFR